MTAHSITAVSYLAISLKFFDVLLYLGLYPMVPVFLGNFGVAFSRRGSKRLLFAEDRAT